MMVWALLMKRAIDGEQMMSKKINFWCDSGANAFSCREGTTTLDELGVTEAEWSAMTDDQKDELMREIACDRLDWGYSMVGDA